MIHRLRKYIAEQDICKPDEKIIIGVSGGIDSVVLCDLFHRLGYFFAIAHCNFHLRDEESNRDAKFVEELAQQYQVEYFRKDFETQQYAKEHQLSLQLAARELRYTWFQELIDQGPYTSFATAHHKDDSIETVFINLLRGTGIAGLHGILPRRGCFIHPLLFAKRSDISCYAESNGIRHVEDSSNLSTKYMRNRIRKELLPLLREIAPGFDRIMSKEIEHFRETEIVFRTVVDGVKEKICTYCADCMKISVVKLKKLHPVKIYLYEILYEYGFNGSVISSIYDTLDDISGKQFFSPSHRCVKDREYLLVTPLTDDVFEKEYLIDKEECAIQFPMPLTIEVLKDVPFIHIERSKRVATLDYEQLTFPLKLRKWEKGDFFFPFGMKGKKTISDFYTNLKYSLVDKENQWLLCSGDDIVWVVGQRIDDRFKITSSSKSVYRIELDGE